MFEAVVAGGAGPSLSPSSGSHCDLWGVPCPLPPGASWSLTPRSSQDLPGQGLGRKLQIRIPGDGEGSAAHEQLCLSTVGRSLRRPLGSGQSLRAEAEQAQALPVRSGGQESDFIQRQGLPELPRASLGRRLALNSGSSGLSLSSCWDDRRVLPRPAYIQ